jgi:NTP pyrophosphatase (non-canonical NTP hydrolase)
MTIEEVQKTVDQWIKSHGVRYFNELTNLAILMEETGELARLMARHYGEQSFKKGKEPADIHKEISDELADLFFVLVCLANQMNVDLTSALKNSLEKKTQRDRDRHANNQKLSQ